MMQISTGIVRPSALPIRRRNAAQATGNVKIGGRNEAHQQCRSQTFKQDPVESGAEHEQISPGAEAAEHKAEGLLSTQVPEHLLDLNNFENLVLAETKDHWNWEMLATVAGEIDDTSLKRLVGRAVREVRKQEADHLARMQRALTEIAAELAHQTMDGSGSEETD